MLHSRRESWNLTTVKYTGDLNSVGKQVNKVTGIFKTSMRNQVLNKQMTMKHLYALYLLHLSLKCYLFLF